MKWQGGERGARKPQSTFYPSLRPGSSHTEAVRQATRHYNEAPRIYGSTANSSGRAGSGQQDDLFVSEFEARSVYHVEDNTTTNVTVGSASGVATYFIDWWLRRNSGTAVYACGRMDILCDGAAVYPVVSESVNPAAAEHGVTLSADVNAGNVRIIITTSNMTPDADADLILFVKQVVVP